MAFKHGSNAALWLNSTDLSAYGTDIAFGVDVDNADTSTFQNTWKSSVAGQALSKVSLKGYYDPAVTPAMQTSLQVENATMTYLPSGITIGDNARLMAVDPTAYAESSPVGGVVGFTYAGQTEGTVGFGYCLLPKTTISITTTGAAKNDLAATTTGAIAHLHVTGMVSNGSWVVAIQDSADGSTGWAPIGTFTAATGLTSQRLVIAGNVRQYIRYVNTVTGGTSPTCTFALAFART